MKILTITRVNLNNLMDSLKRDLNSEIPTKDRLIKEAFYNMLKSYNSLDKTVSREETSRKLLEEKFNLSSTIYKYNPNMSEYVESVGYSLGRLIKLIMLHEEQKEYKTQ